MADNNSTNNITAKDVATFLANNPASVTDMLATHPNLLAICLAAAGDHAKNNNQIDSKGIKIKIVSAPKSQTYESLLRDCKIGTSTVIIKKKILKKNFRFSILKTKEDLLLWLQLSKKYDLIGYNKVLSEWRKLDNSLSSSTMQKICDGFRLYYKYEGFNIFKSIYYLIILSLNFIRKNI